MPASFDTGAFERATDPIMRFFGPDQARKLPNYRADEPLRQRITELASRNSEGDLTDLERAEYEGYVRANNFIGILQSKARKRLATSCGGH